MTRKDSENADEFLEPGGFIFFGDSAESAPFGVHRLVQEIEASPQYELVIQNANVLFVKK